MPLWIFLVLGLICVLAVVLFLVKQKGPQGNEDAQTIDRFLKAGLDQSTACEIEFLFYFPSPASADRVSAQLQANGYAVSVDEVVKGSRCILRAVRSMAPVLPELQALRSQMDELASREGGMYEGWTPTGSLPRDT